MCVFSYDLYFFFAHNIDVSAEGYKPSCNSLFKSYSCDTVGAACTFGSRNKLYMSGLDRKDYRCYFYNTIS